jgi:hypothetical protein
VIPLGDRKLTLARGLAERGFGHRKASPPVEGRQEVYRLDTGEVVGLWRWHEAWAFLREREAGQAEAAS